MKDLAGVDSGLLSRIPAEMRQNLAPLAAALADPLNNGVDKMQARVIEDLKSLSQQDDGEFTFAQQAIGESQKSKKRATIKKMLMELLDEE
jgi:hypothetical protein